MTLFSCPILFENEISLKQLPYSHDLTQGLDCNFVVSLFAKQQDDYILMSHKNLSAPAPVKHLHITWSSFFVPAPSFDVCSLHNIVTDGSVTLLLLHSVTVTVSHLIRASINTKWSQSHGNLAGNEA